MYAYENARPVPFGTVITHQAGDVAEAILAAIRSELAVWRTRSALSALSDRALADIGIDRAGIAAAARRAVKA